MTTHKHIHTHTKKGSNFIDVFRIDVHNFTTSEFTLIKYDLAYLLEFDWYFFMASFCHFTELLLDRQAFFESNFDELIKIGLEINGFYQINGIENK